VAKAAKQTFPGNEIPLFRANKEAESRREALVAELKKVNRCKFFTDAAIREHIKDTLAERRRRVTKGYDFTQVNLLSFLVPCDFILKIHLATSD